MSYCKKCKAYLFDSEISTHRCLPAWRCWQPDEVDEDDARTVYAADAEDAAEKYAEIKDSDDREWSSDGDTVSINVRGADGEVTAWLVDCGVEAYYRGRKAE